MRIMRPSNNDTRIIKRFAIIPVGIDKEIRWLEFVYIEQIYSDFYGSWLNNRFVDQDRWKMYKKEKN